MKKNNINYFCYIVIVSTLVILTTGCSGFGKIKILGDEYIFLPFPVSKETKSQLQSVSIGKETPTHLKITTPNLTMVGKQRDK